MPARLFRRRRFLAGLGALGAAGLLAACGGSSAPAAAPTTASTGSGAAPPSAPSAAPTTAPAAGGAQPTTAPAGGAATAPAAAAATTPAAAKPATGGAAPTPLRLHVRLGAEEDLWSQWLPKWEQENNAKVELVQSPGGEHVQKMQTLIAGGQLGDVVHNFTGDSSFQLFFASGVTIPLDKFIADEKYDLNQFYPFTIAITKLDGKVGGLPFKGHPSRVGIFYNRTLLEAAGAKVPTNDSTYDDLIEAAKKAHKPDAQQYGWSNPGLDSEWYILMSRFGGSKDIYSKDGTKSQLNDPEVQAGWTWTYEMFNKHKVGISPFSTNPDINQLFTTGKIALLRANVGTKAAFAQIKDFKWGMSVAPKGPKGQRGSLSQADVMGATKFSKTPDVAWKLVKGLCSKEAGIILGKQQGGSKSATPGGRPDVYESPDLLNLPFPEDVQKNTMFAMQNAEPFTQPANYRGPEIQRAIDPLYQELILDKSKADKAFYDRLHQAVQDILDKPKP
ncbi:MAG TPA: sugar ABC transporter substrate-binding protein [Chloroflexota bacterium]|nr:sugar ABC transporter substrate-binding protein [Chloroflexota bacterium]